MSAELDYEMDLATALSFGCLPEPYLVGTNQEKADLLNTYATVYLKEEIMAEALTRNLHGFTRFLSVAAACAGQLLDFSKISARAKVPRQSAIRYFEILEDTLIASRVEAFPFEGNADLVKHPRYYFFDNGVLNALLKDFAASEERKGRLFEQHIYNQILHSAKARNEPIEIFHFRTRWGQEIDFIVKCHQKLFAIEVKHTKLVNERDVKSLEAVDAYAGKKIEKFVAYSGVTEKKIGSVMVLPWQKVLEEMGL